jgi:MFS family permease
MIKKTLIAPVLTLCFVQVISTALVTYIFPFVAACKPRKWTHETYTDLLVLLSMDIEEREVPIYAGWADSTISIADIIFLPLVSGRTVSKDKLTIQHVRLIRYYPHRPLIVVTLLLSGGIAGVLGFCRSPWQLVALRGMVGMVHFGGFMSVIGLGEIVDEEARNEGKPVLLFTTPRRLIFSILVACGRECYWLHDGVDCWRIPLGAIWQGTGDIGDEAIPRQTLRRSWTVSLRHHHHR